MKKIVGWPLAWGLFWTGHVLSKALYVDSLAFVYPAYNWLMCASGDLQEWAGLDGPWKTVVTYGEEA